MRILTLTFLLTLLSCGIQNQRVAGENFTLDDDQSETFSGEYTVERGSQSNPINLQFFPKNQYYAYLDLGQTPSSLELKSVEYRARTLNVLHSSKFVDEGTKVDVLSITLSSINAMDEDGKVLNFKVILKNSDVEYTYNVWAKINVVDENVSETPLSQISYLGFVNDLTPQQELFLELSSDVTSLRIIESEDQFGELTVSANAMSLLYTISNSLSEASRYTEEVQIGAMTDDGEIIIELTIDMRFTGSSSE